MSIPIQELANPLQVVRGLAVRIASDSEATLNIRSEAKLMLRDLDAVLQKLKEPSLEAQLEASIAELKKRKAQR